MLGLGPDDPFQFQAFFGHVLFHDVGGLLLGIQFAGIGDGWAVEKIDRVIGAVVPVPKLLFVPGRLDGFILEMVEKLAGLRESCTG